MNSILGAKTCTERVKRRWPQPPEETAPPEIWLIFYMIKSRRRGLSDEEFAEFTRLYLELEEQIYDNWHERWLASLADTFAENGELLGLVASSLRMMEKLSNPTRKPKDEYERRASLDGVDIHQNLAKRVGRQSKGKEHLARMVQTMWRKLAEDPDSVIGRFNRLSKKDMVATFDSTLHKANPNVRR